MPDFGDADLKSDLESNGIAYKFEVDSPYPSEAVYANFERMANPVNANGYKDPVTGKIFKSRFSLDYGDKKLFFVMETYPYHTGSKAVIYAYVPGIETSQNVIDYKIILADVKRKLAAIAKD